MDYRYLLQSNTDRFQRMSFVACCALVLVGLIFEIIEQTSGAAYMFDEFLYTSTYMDKLECEGRWFNWLLYPLARTINPHIACVINIIFFFIFSLKLTQQILPSNGGSYILASLVPLFFPFVHGINDWPQSYIPTYFVLMMTPFLKESLVPKYKCCIFLFFILTGILFHGVFVQFYFIMPLLFIKEIHHGNIAKILLSWIVGFVVGAIGAELVTYLVCGHFIEPLSCRNIHIPSSMGNIYTQLSCMKRSVISAIIFFSLPNLFICILSLPLFLRNVIKRDDNSICVGILLLFVLSGVYVMGVVIGVSSIEIRTAVPFYFALYVFLLFNIKKSNVLIAFSALIMSSQLLYGNIEDIHYRNGVRDVWMKDFLALGFQPHELSGIILLSSHRDVCNSAERIRKDLRISQYFSSQGYAQAWSSIPLEAGFRRVYVEDGGMAEKLKELDINPSEVNYSASHGYEYALVKGYLVLKLR